MKIGFIGLGIMGTPMALNIVKGGHKLYVNTRSDVPKELLEHEAVACKTAKEVAENTDVIFTMVPNTPDVEMVLFGEEGICQADISGKTIVDMSSISPVDTKQFAKQVEEKGGKYLDAPVSGGDVGAKAGTLSIMVGGDQTVFDKILPIFQLMGKNITLVGGNGDGQTAKVANQIIVGLTIEAVAEALLFASKAGADPAKVRQALLGGFASSKILEVHGERMYKRTFEPGFRVNLHQKDLNLALGNAQALGISLPATALAQQLFNNCAAHDGAGLDHSSIIKALEKMANYEIPKQS